MKIILSRHGNTFNPGDPVVWAGLKNDLPLVEKGKEQAERFANYLATKNIKPAAIYCGSLQRTYVYASILIQRLKLPSAPIVDARLNEIDYGDWTGLTQEQVISKFGEKTFKDWEENSKWPSQGNWKGSESETISQIKSFIQELIEIHDENDTLIVISSNGKLRYFLTLIAGEFERRIQKGQFKVKTGNICQLECSKTSISLIDWNIDPAMR